MSGTRMEVMNGGTDTQEEEATPFKFETYATKKTFAQGLLDIGLLVANASQLKSLISLGSEQDFYYVNMVLILLSIALQVIVGVLLTIIGTSKLKVATEKNRAERLNDVVMAIVFVITVLNLFTAAFGIESSDE